MIPLLSLKLSETVTIVSDFEMSALKGKQSEVVIATKFAAYPWRLTSGQFVNACRSL